MDSKSERASVSTITDLGPELLNAIFCKLGPSPMHLAPVPSVCKAWRAVMEESTRKHLCLLAAPALCRQMKYDKAPPLGGWRPLYKLVSYCPGILQVFYEKTQGFSNTPWFGKLGHVRQGGFMTGPKLMSDGLRFRTPFLEDVLFVSHACEHYGDNELSGYMHGCRGLVRDFPNSKIAAALFIEQTETGEGDLSESLGEDALLCTYCREPLYNLPKEQFFDHNYRRKKQQDTNNEQRIDCGLNTEGFVCRNGHLTLGILAEWVEISKVLPGTGEGIGVQAAKAVYKCCLHLGPDLKEEVGPDFVKDLDLFSLPRRVEALLAAWESDVKLKSLKSRKWQPTWCSKPKIDEAGALTELCKDLPKVGGIVEVVSELFPQARSSLRKHLLQGLPELSSILEDIRGEAARLECQDLRLEQMELALEEAGVQELYERCARERYWQKWPAQVSVRRFVEKGDISIEDVVAAQAISGTIRTPKQKERRRCEKELQAKLQAKEGEKRRALAAKALASLEQWSCRSKWKIERS